MKQTQIEDLLGDQTGVITRRQLKECQATDVDIRRMLRRRELSRVYEGVYVNHTGPLTPEQRGWAATLLHWPAALAGDSALEAHGVRDSKDRESDQSPVELVVARDRRVDDPPGVRTRQTKDFDRIALMNLSPPRVRLEHAALVVASRAGTETAAVAVLADSSQSRRTTAKRLLHELEQMPTLARRALLREVLGDVANGTNSVLEHRFLVRVQQPHGLPLGVRQQRVVNGKRSAYRDVDLPEFRVVVELQGKLGHDRAVDRWADLDRDVAAAIAGDLTVRIGWGQVLVPCRLAVAVGAVLGSRGWTGSPMPCGSDCLVPQAARFAVSQ